MPPKKPLDSCFEELPHNLARVRCKSCSAQGLDCTLDRKGIRKHLDSEGHKRRAMGQSSNIGVGIGAEVRSQVAQLQNILDNVMRDNEDSAPYMDTDWPEGPFDDSVYEADDGVYLDAEGQPINFSAGAQPYDLENEALRLMRDLESFSMWGDVSSGTAMRSLGGDAEEAWADASETNVGQLQQDTFDMDGDDSDSDDSPGLDDSANHPWFPYTNKTMFMLDLIDNLPRLRLSDAHMRLMLWVLKEGRSHEVPAFSALRKKQTELAKTMGIQTRLFRTGSGNVFFMNDLGMTLALDYANPKVRPFLVFYPEAEPLRTSESWHALKWAQEVHSERLTPMWASGKTHFYLNEVAELQDGRLVVPLRWVTRQGVVCADCVGVRYYAGLGCSVVHEEDTVSVPAQDFKFNFLDLQADGVVTNFAAGSAHWQAKMPNPLRAVAKGRPLYTSHIKAWADDVSGNTSKQYNAHLNIYLAHANLPHEKLSQEYFVRFSSTSPHASSAEQFSALAQQLQESDECFVAWDCLENTEICFRVLLHNLPADNPQQSDTASHIGLHGNFFCRACHVGGTQKEKESDEGYPKLFEPGRPRSATETLAAVKAQLFAAGLGGAGIVEDLQRASGVKDSTAQRWIEKLLAKATELHKVHITHPETRDPRLSERQYRGDARKAIVQEIKETIQEDLRTWLIQQPPERFEALPADSPLRLELCPGVHYNVLLAAHDVDVNQDTPVENLHTYLLGQDKYVWHLTHSAWDLAHCTTFSTRLQSCSIDGLSIPPIPAKYMVQYRNNLIGRHFKTLQQTAVFNLHADLCPPLVFELWKATGELGALLWFHEIEFMEMYLADLSVLIANVLDIWAQIDPARIVVKPKLHILVHLIANIRRFGPAPLFSTEIFECFNAIFRMCSVLSNHHAPSRDIAIALADMERIKHIVSGGYWKTNEGEWVRAGERVRQMWLDNPIIQRHLGWADRKSVVPGDVKLQASKKRHPRAWPDTLASRSHPVSPQPSVALWEDCKHVVASSRDLCKVSSWIFAQTPEGTCAGRILEILQPSSIKIPLVVMEQFDVLDMPDPRLNMPRLVRPATDAITHLLAPKDILFIFNAQHDCHRATCTATGVRVQMQERLPSQITENTIVHQDDLNYIINMHGIHNAALLRKILPRSLTQPKPYATNRPEVHREIARGLRVTQTAKRAATAAKAAATRAKKAAAKGTAGQPPRLSQHTAPSPSEGGSGSYPPDLTWSHDNPAGALRPPPDELSRPVTPADGPGEARGASMRGTSRRWNEGPGEDESESGRQRARITSEHV